MSIRRFSLYAALSVGLAALSTAYSAATLAIERFVGAMFTFVARPSSIIPAFARTATAGGPALAYDAPPQHFLRHEAGMSRRAAHRNI